ncbi:MAG: TonB family protein [Bacteroidota bacterium]
MKTLAETKNELKELIPEGIDVVIKALKTSLVEGTDKYNDLILIEGRYQDLTRQLVQGILTDEASTVGFNTIRKDLLAFIDDLQESSLQGTGGVGADGKPDMHNGEILYRIPKQMQKGKASKCLVRLAFDRKVILQDYDEAKGDVLKDIRISEVMGVELLDPMGEAFEIRTMHDTVQFVEKDLFTEWVFFVKPILEGMHQLVLKISVIEIKNGIERKRNVVLEEDVKIITTVVEETGIKENELQSAGMVMAVSKAAHSKIAGKPSEPAPKGMDVSPQTVVPKAVKAGKAGIMKIASIASALAVLVIASVVVFSGGGERSVAPDPGGYDIEELTDVGPGVDHDDPILDQIKDYLNKYPNEKIDESPNLDDLANIENAAWEAAVNSDDPDHLKDFLRTFPNSKHVPEATQLIADLGNSNSPEAETGEPEPENTPTNARPPESQPSEGETPPNNVADEEPAPEPEVQVQTPKVDPEQPISISTASLKPCYKGCRKKKRDQKKEDKCTNDEIRNFIKKNLRYPVVARENRIEGTVMVRFIIERDGEVTNVQYDKDIGGGCGKEAVRLVQKMPKFEPGLNQKGEEARIKYNLPITFKLLN